MLCTLSDIYKSLQGAKTVGQRMRRLMEQQDMSLAELHRRSKVAKGYLSELLNDDPETSRRKPSGETLFEIGNALGVTVGDLLGRTLPTDKDVRSWPPGLAAYVREEKVPAQEARMLAGIRTRGGTPQTPDDWRHVHRTIRMYSESGS
jgi:transcriptional regulator with XRE-family HTH domain